MSLYLGPIDFSVTLDGIEVDPDPDQDVVYYSDAGAGALYKLVRPGMGVGTPSKERIPFAETGFKSTFRDGRQIVQTGLAIDSRANLYCDNAASDDQFGGRLFKFSQPDGSRAFTGTINYFSQLLMFAQPTLSGPMVIKPDPDPAQEDLYVVDNLSQEIKRVPVNQSWDPYRRVGQLYAVIPPDPQSVGRAIDMEFDAHGGLYLLDGWRVLRFENGVPELEALFAPE
jgi:sugar lactone lactonase YvrE